MKKYVCLFIVLLAIPAYGQEWKQKHDAIKELYLAYQFEDAFAQGLRHLAYLKQKESHTSPAALDITRLMVLISYSAGMFEQGEKYARQELALRKAQSLESSPEYAEALYHLALLKIKEQDYNAAISLLEQAQQHYSQASPARDMPQLLSLYLAQSYIYEAQYTQADSILNSLKNNTEGSSATETQALRYYLSFRLAQAKGDETAKEQLEQAVHYFEQTEQSDILPLKAEALYSLAYEHMKSDSLAKALSCYQVLHQLYQEQHLSDTLQWGSVLNNLGQLSLKLEPELAQSYLNEAYQFHTKYALPQSEGYWASIDNYAMSLYERTYTDSALAIYKKHRTLVQQNERPANKAYASALNNQALIYKELGETDKAIYCFTTAEEVLNGLQKNTREERLQLSTVYYNLARTHQELTQYDSAIFFYKRSTEMSKLAKANLSSEYLAAITGMAGLYQDIGYFTESEIFYQEALRIQEQVGGEESNVYASILSNYALLYQEIGAFEEAKETFEKALQLKRKLVGIDHPEYIAVLSNLGLLALEQANYEQARRMLETVLIKNENLYGNRHPQVAQSLTNLARLEIALGSYPEAEPLLKQALEIQAGIYSENHPAYAITAIEMANFYMQLGNYEAAEPLLIQSRDVLKRSYGTYHPDYATATQNLAVLYEAKGNKELTESYLLETLTIDEQTLGKQHPSYAIALNNLASFYQNNDSLSKAMPLLEDALKICRNGLGKEHPLYTSTLLNLALLYQDLQDYQKAAPLLDEVVALRKKLLGDKHPDYAYALYGKAVNSYRLQRYDEVEPIFNEVIDLYSWQLREYFPALSEKEKSAFYQRIEPVLNSYRDYVMNMNLRENLIPVARQQQLLANLYNLQLVTKAMLLDASSKIRRSIFQSGDESLIELYEQWLFLKEQLAKYYTLSAQELNARALNLRKIEREANDLEKQLSASSRIFARSLETRELSWKDIQQQLKPEEAAIEILRISKNQEQPTVYIALIVEPNTSAPRLAVMPDGLAMETKNFNYYKNAIAYRIEDELSYNMYWRNIANLLSADVQTVYVAPDGIYNKISLQSLYNPVEGRFLLDEINVRMLSSTRELTEDIEAAPTDKRNEALVLGFPEYQMSFANLTASEQEPGAIQAATEANPSLEGARPLEYSLEPLPGTRTEINAVGKMMEAKNWNVTKLMRDQANEETIKKVLMPDVLHFATHGYFLSDLPADMGQRAFGIHMQNITANPLLRSGLLLAGAASTLRNTDSLNLETEDGVLTAYEAMNLNLSGTDLVVLSACETGLGEVKNGEGVYGLQRAFLVAGARSVLMSLWKVNDESTTELIRLFYENWLSGQSKAEALLNAQRQMREKYEEPYHWAPFVLIGR